MALLMYYIFFRCYMLVCFILSVHRLLSLCLYTAGDRIPSPLHLYLYYAADVFSIINILDDSLCMLVYVIHNRLDSNNDSLIPSLLMIVYSLKVILHEHFCYYSIEFYLRQRRTRT